MPFSSAPASPQPFPLSPPNLHPQARHRVEYLDRDVELLNLEMKKWGPFTAEGGQGKGVQPGGLEGKLGTGGEWGRLRVLRRRTARAAD